MAESIALGDLTSKFKDMTKKNNQKKSQFLFLSVSHANLYFISMECKITEPDPPPHPQKGKM